MYKNLWNVDNQILKRKVVLFNAFAKKIIYSPFLNTIKEKNEPNKYKE